MKPDVRNPSLSSSRRLNSGSRTRAWTPVMNIVPSATVYLSSSPASGRAIMPMKISSFVVGRAAVISRDRAQSMISRSLTPTIRRAWAAKRRKEPESRAVNRTCTA